MSLPILLLIALNSVFGVLNLSCALAAGLCGSRKRGMLGLTSVAALSLTGTAAFGLELV